MRNFYIGITKVNSTNLLFHKNSELISSYHFKKNGIIISFKDIVSLNNLEFSTVFSISPNKYFAQAQWAERTNLNQNPSFIHKSFGLDFKSSMSIHYLIFPSVHTGIKTETYMSKGFKGVDYLFYKNGNIAKTQFNGSQNKYFNFGLSVLFKI